MKTIQFLKEENNRLRETIGRWRRLAQEKSPRRECMREGYSTDYGGYHYKVYLVQDVPSDLPIQEVLQVLRESFLPKVFPYQFRKIDYSRRFNGWLVEVQKPMNVDMFISLNE